MCRYDAPLGGELNCIVLSLPMSPGLTKSTRKWKQATQKDDINPRYDLSSAYNHPSHTGHITLFGGHLEVTVYDAITEFMLVNVIELRRGQGIRINRGGDE